MIPKESPKTLASTIIALCEMQDTLNEVVIKGWKDTDTPYLRAAWVELSEGFKHLNWAWWKKIEPNIDEYKTELIDSLHFTLSALILRYKHFDEQAFYSKVDEILNRQKYYEDFNRCRGRLSNVEHTIETLLPGMWNDRIPNKVLQLMYDEEMDLKEIVFRYTIKNVLNQFRQANGYKTGDYVKVWNGKEDNEYVVDMVMNRPDADELFVLFSNDREKFLHELFVLMSEAYVTIDNVSAEDNAAAYKG